MGANWFDLHLHSYFSDGRLSPEDLIRECKRTGLAIVALTDHESVKGVPWAISEGKRLGVTVIPGIEFSTDFDGEEQHLLGLGINYKSEELARFLKTWEVTKRQQIEKMVSGLKEIGFSLEFSEVAVQSCGALNRVHIAYALLDKAENAPVLERFNLQSSNDLFKKFLKEDSPIYAKREMPQTADVVRLIKRLGGTAIWAHPLWKQKNPAILKKRARFLQGLGLDGLEVGYSSDYQGRPETVVLHQIAKDLSMLETAGSDFHSFEIPFFNKIANFELLELELNLPYKMFQCFT